MDGYNYNKCFGVKKKLHIKNTHLIINKFCYLIIVPTSFILSFRLFVNTRTYRRCPFFFLHMKYQCELLLIISNRLFVIIVFVCSLNSMNKDLVKNSDDYQCSFHFFFVYLVLLLINIIIHNQKKQSICSCVVLINIILDCFSFIQKVLSAQSTWIFYLNLL